MISWRFLSGLSIPALATASSAAAPCRLAFLQLRSRDLAVDLTPSFDPEVFNYAATLEFAMEEFSIDAKVPEGCELSGLPNRPFLAPAPNREGEENAKETNLCVRDPPSGKEQWYRISVTKLAGSETEVLGLQLRGGELHPSFEPAVRSYTAHMDVAYEFIQVSYVVLDNGQRLRWKATPEVPEATVGGHDRDGPNEDDGGNTTEERRLTGEKQHFLRHEVFPIDVGYTRKVTLSIQSADPMQAARGVYFLEVTRGHCPPRQPFFEPRTRACTLECPQGTYPNHAQGRCSYFNRNCAVCQTLAICELCLQDTIQHSFIINKGDGSCKMVEKNFFVQYYWWCVSGSICGALLLCMMIISLCQCLCDYCCSRRRVRHFDSDLD